MTITATAPVSQRGDRSIKYRITLAGPAGAEIEIAGYLFHGEPGKPAGPVTPGHAGTSGRLNYGSLTRRYARVTMIPVAFAALCEAADLTGYRPVRVTVEANPLHGTWDAVVDVPTPWHLAAAVETAMGDAGVTIHHSGIPGRLYAPGPGVLT